MARRTATPPQNAEAERAVRFFSRYGTHTKGEWAGRPFNLEAWQERIVRDLFGTLLPDGRRQYRNALIGIPRKNGKSTLCAPLALKLLCYDSEPGAEVYGAAADKDQARIVFGMASDMVNASKKLSDILTVYKNSIVYEAKQSVFKVLSADAFTKHGLNPHGVIVDELHAQPNRELWDVLTSGQGARRQPLTVAITTAGFDRTSICFEIYEYVQQILAGVIDDPTWYGAWFGAPDDADWLDELVWAAANPNLDVSVSLDFLRTEARQAKQIPARQNTFRRLYLNQWTQANIRWLDLGLWDENAGLVTESKLEGRECFAGLDLASTSDFTALLYAFPGEQSIEVLCRFFLPRAALERRSAMRPMLEVWEREGFLIVTDGDVVDDSVIVSTIVADRGRFNIKTLAYDPWNARGVIPALEDRGLECMKTPQTMARLSGPSKELERLLGDRKLRHGGHPILRWMADNVVSITDGDGRIKPDRKKSTEKIDGIVALVMALGETMVSPEVSEAGAFLNAITWSCPCGALNSLSDAACHVCHLARVQTVG